MDEAEVEIVAEELAKLGGASWYPGREHGPILRVVHERYRDRARAAIAALDRYRGKVGNEAAMGDLRDSPGASTAPDSSPVSYDIKVGSTVIYRPPGDRRSYPCTVEKIRNGFVYLVPQDRSGISWVPISELVGSATLHDLQAEGASDTASHQAPRVTDTAQKKHGVP